MKDKIMKLFMDKKKAGKEISGEEQAAKMKIAKELISSMDGMMGDKLKGMKKVTVASPTQEGLKEGLEKAEDMIQMAPEMEQSEEEQSEESEESEEAPEMEEMSEEELDAKLAELMAKKEKLKAQKA